MHAPSPITNPARVASNGRDASVGSSSSATSPRMAQKPARISGWMQRLGAAGEHDVGVAAPDRLGALADRVRAGRAGGHRRVVRAADAELDRDLAARRVDEHVRDEERRDAVRGRARGAIVVLLDDRRQCRRSPSRAGSRRGPGRIAPTPRRPTPPARPRRRAGRCAPSGAPPSAARPAAGSKSFDLGGDAHRVAARVEAWMKPIPLRPRPRPPTSTARRADRRDRPEPGDRDATHPA